MTHARTAAAALALLLAACAAPLTVRNDDPRDVYRGVTAYALNSDGMSDDAAVTLARADLLGVWEDDPRAALDRLAALVAEGDFRARLYALSELSYLAAERSGDRSLFLASAVHAHLFLFAPGPEPLPGPFRRRFRRACDLNGVALARAFTDERGEFVPAAGRVAVPGGAADVVVPEMPLRFGGFAYDDLRPAATLTVEGFRARAVRSGLGAPLVARRSEGSMRDERRAHLASGSALALTAFLHVEGSPSDLARGILRARIEFFRPTGAREVVVAGQTVPVEFDVTAPLAAELDERRPWEKEVSAFTGADAAEVWNEIYLAEPYEPGRIPVVLVHGTASSPARWAELLNELHDDGDIAANFQFWFYEYGSGAPILASAAGLRRQIARVAKDLDPEAKDPALRQMVVIGHSQGGLLTRLAATASGERFWSTVSDRPFAEFELSDSARKLVQPVFWFEPSPYVSRLVFVATPQRGSHVAGNWIGRIGASLVSVPATVAKGTARLARAAVGAGGFRLDNYSTAVDDMSPGSAFLRALEAQLPTVKVPMHSIVAVDAEGDVDLEADGDDGVVAYASAHLPEARSEVVVRSDHSCQGHPGTVAEIRRILHEHLRSVGR